MTCIIEIKQVWVDLRSRNYRFLQHGQTVIVTTAVECQVLFLEKPPETFRLAALITTFQRSPQRSFQRVILFFPLLIYLTLHSGAVGGDGSQAHSLCVLHWVSVSIKQRQNKRLQSPYGPYSADQTSAIYRRCCVAYWWGPLNFSKLTGAPLGHVRRLEGRNIIDLN